MIFLPLMISALRRPLAVSNRDRLLWGAMCGICILLFPLAGGAFRNQKTWAASGTAASASVQEKHREGMRLSGVTGTFQDSSRRWVFTADGDGPAYKVLENLPLERIARAIGEDPQDKRWKVSGTLTEYYDDNYLLIDRIERAPRDGRSDSD